MSRDLFVLIAFCVFILLLGMRIRQRFADWQKGKKGAPEQQPRKSREESAQEPPEVKARRIRREKRVRIFTIAQLVVLGGLMVFMIPVLVRDFMVPGRVDTMNIVLRCLIFIFTIYVFILGYLKVFARKDRDNRKE